MYFDNSEKCKNVIESGTSFFALLTEQEKKLLADNIQCIVFKKGETIFKEGDKSSGLFFLIEGKVKIFKEGIGGREQIIRLAKPIGFIGYRSFFADEPHNTSAEAMEESIISILPNQIFYKLIEGNAKLVLAIFKSFATELGLTYSRTITLTQKHIRGRLAESLIFIRDTYGLEKDDSTLVAIMTREELANLSNMTTSNAIRTLSTFAAEGIIALEGKRIRILDFEKLQRISEMG